MLIEIFDRFNLHCTVPYKKTSFLTGIRLLEENLVQKTWDEEKPAKRARMAAAEPSGEMTTWIELAR